MSRRCHHGSARHFRPMGHEPRPASGIVDHPSLAEPEAGVDYRGSRAGGFLQAAPRSDHDAAPQPRALPADRRLAEGIAASASLPAASYRPFVPAHQPTSPVLPPGPGAMATRDRELDPARLEGIDHGTTAPQLRRFIKSRAYVPMHELRRRFGINGDGGGGGAVGGGGGGGGGGLPPKEGSLLGELLRAGDI